jgi:hypothetical protein
MLKKGSKVKLWFYDNVEEISAIPGILDHIPCNTGDSIYITRDDGKQVMVNPNSATFERMEEE